MGDKSVLRIKPGSMCCCHTVEKDMGAEKRVRGWRVQEKRRFYLTLYKTNGISETPTSLAQSKFPLEDKRI